ncbi:MAG: GTP-binding protein [Coprobacillus sp.]|nr:GTP-binding protein [Coprobacillus sp.]
MKKTVIGILAHVDAGKTTLSESMLYLAGSIRKLGRVDHGNAFLDYNHQEKERGITIFSKQAMFDWKDVEITLIDTPGHVDFSSEMERTLQILDYAILVISSIDGVQNHTKTIWELLKYYQIPTFIFLNKIDILQTDIQNLIKELQNTIDDKCLDFTHFSKESLETIALNNETLLNEYLETQTLKHSSIQEAIYKRETFPCYFGSALKMEGVKEFLDSITSFIKEKNYPQEFKAKVYKITRDTQGQRLVHMKITGGSLKVKQQLDHYGKVDQIRQYIGNKYQVLDEVYAGSVCAIQGLKNIQLGEGLGTENYMYQPLLEPYMNYHIILPQDCDKYTMIHNIKQLAEEDPNLHIQFSDENDDILIQLMGEIQIEILKKIIADRFHVDVEISQGNIIYKETIIQAVEGIGHYEPLRHYAEVHLLLEPGERGSGLHFSTQCSEDVLDKHWQNLILTHLKEKKHIGVLTGAAITDIKITLLTGKAHLKHTEGGDFREATYRAVRHGLKCTESILLEPYFQFRLEVPQEYLSRAIFDIENMKGHFTISTTLENIAVVEGQAPVRKMKNYQKEVVSYTKGQGKLYCSLSGYQQCEDQDEVVASMQYDSEKDIHNPTGSIFCSHGAGFYVKWNDVKEYMHIDSEWNKQSQQYQHVKYSTSLNEEQELEDIFTRTYGTVKRRLSDSFDYKKELDSQVKIVQPLPECLLVDGYNVIYSWPELKNLAKNHLDTARTRLIDILGNYQGYKQCLLIIVFDAYKVKGNLGTVEQLHNVHIVYTKEAQTADMYIEHVTHQLSQKYNVVVATSDALEQMIVIGRGARRMSSRELKLEVESLVKTKKEEFERKQEKNHNLLLEDIQKYQK